MFFNESATLRTLHNWIGFSSGMLLSITCQAEIEARPLT
jgi:hypothetical protein